MKKILIILSFFCHQSMGSQNFSFGIYLLKDASLNAYEAVEIGLNNLILQEQPLLTIEDFKSYKCANHQFELTSEGESKLPEASVTGLPFVFVADKSKIYLGAFWSSFSSFDFAYPVIDTEWFKLTGELKIARSYPHEGFAIGDDPRANAKIMKVLKSNHVLKDSCP